MTKNINLLVLSLIFLLVGAAIGYNLRPDTQTISQTPSEPTPTQATNLSYYENLLKNDRQVVIKNPQPADLTGDSESEVIYITSGEGCASCHAQTIRIFDGESEIFNLGQVFDDALFVPGDKAFMIFQPIRKEGEPLCCPTSFYPITYIWDGQTFQEQK